MNGIQRFFLCGLSLFLVMLCFPHYAQGVGWSFAGMTMLICAGALLVLSILVGLFGLDRFNFFNRLLTFAVWIGFSYYVLLNFPQQDNIAPINKIKNGQFPTRADLALGARHFTFAFDLMPEMQNNTNNPSFGPNGMPYLDGDPDELKAKAQAAKSAPVKKKKVAPKKEEEEAKVEIFMEDEEGYVDAAFMPDK